MGRPRKRRREGEADDPAETQAETENDHNSHLNDAHSMSGFHAFGLVSPPELQEYDYSSGSTENSVVTPLQHGPAIIQDYQFDNVPVVE